MIFARRFVSALTGAALLAFSGPALADTASRFPATGPSYVQVTTPDDWQAQVTDAAISVTAGDSSCFLYASLLPWSEMPSRDPAFLAKDMFGALGVNDPGLPAPGAIDGRQGKSFSAATNRNGATGRLHMTLSPLGETGMAIAVDFCFDDAQPESLKARDAAIASVKITAP